MFKMLITIMVERIMMTMMLMIAMVMTLVMLRQNYFLVNQYEKYGWNSKF